MSSEFPSTTVNSFPSPRHSRAGIQPPHGGAENFVGKMAFLPPGLDSVRFSVKVKNLGMM